MDTNIEEAIRIMNNLVSLIYDLYPDEEYEEEFEAMFNMKTRIAQAQAWVDKQST